MDTLLNKYNVDGYIVMENFFHRHECDELHESGVELTKHLPHINQRTVFSTTDHEKKHIVDKYFLHSNDKVRYFFEKDAVNDDGSLKVHHSVSLNKVGHALHYLHPIFRRYTYSERVKRVCRKLKLVDPAVVQSMYIFKNPGVGGEVVAHQDATYLFTEPIPPVGFWIALEDATIENGCLWIAKGSHNNGVHRRLLRNLDENAAQALMYDRPVENYQNTTFTPIPVRKGTCIVLHGLVVHKSEHNKSDQSRHAYTFHVIEKQDNQYSPQNWLQEGPDAPFDSLYEKDYYLY